MVEMTQLRIVLAEFQRLSVCKLEPDPPVPDRGDLGRVAVREPEPEIVAGPADAVAGAQVHGLCPVDLDPAAFRPDLAGPPRNGFVPGILQHHRPLGSIHPGDATLVALRDSEAPAGSENGGDKLVHGSGGISQPRAE